MKDNKNKFIYIGLGSMVIVFGFYFFQYEANDSKEFNYSTYLKRPLPNMNKNTDTEDNLQDTSMVGKEKSDVKSKGRTIAQRVEKPHASYGPKPKVLRRKHKSDVPYQSSEFDNEIGGLTLKHNIHAIKNTEDLPADYKILDEKLGYFIVQTNGTPSDALGVVSVDGGSDYAIFTGILKIKFSNIEFASDILNDFDGIIAQDYSHIQTIHFHFDQFEKTMQAFHELQNNPEIKSVEVELLQYQRSSK